MESITRESLLRSKTYWTVSIQNKLFNAVREYMEKNNINKTQFAQQNGVSKGYVTQLLNGDFDNKISKLVELSLAIGLVPEISFTDVEEAISNDRNKYVLRITCNSEYINEEKPNDSYNLAS